MMPVARISSSSTLLRGVYDKSRPFGFSRRAFSKSQAPVVLALDGLAPTASMTSRSVRLSASISRTSFSSGSSKSEPFFCGNAGRVRRRRSPQPRGPRGRSLMAVPSIPTFHICPCGNVHSRAPRLSGDKGGPTPAAQRRASLASLRLPYPIGRCATDGVQGFAAHPKYSAAPKAVQRGAISATETNASTAFLSTSAPRLPRARDERQGDEHRCASPSSTSEAFQENGRLTCFPSAFGGWFRPRGRGNGRSEGAWQTPPPPG
jgi:hypothetical protein